MQDERRDREDDVREAVVRLYRAAEGFTRAFTAWEKAEGPERVDHWERLASAERDLEGARRALRSAEMTRRPEE